MQPDFPLHPSDPIDSMSYGPNPNLIKVLEKHRMPYSLVPLHVRT
jgi:hypothetical protein